MSRRQKHAPSFKTEKKFRLKNVCSLPLFDERPSYHRVYRWWLHGIRGTRLEGKREGAIILTSAEAVTRFLEATQ